MDGLRSIGTFLLASVAALAATTASARPGTYTDYDFKQPGIPSTFDRYDMFVTWESAPTTGAIYPAFTFGFERGGGNNGANGGGGYMGTQVSGLDHLMLFSIWDSEAGTTAIPGPGCSRFGGEGTGAHCGGPYPWVEGREYRLRVELAGSTADGDDWRGTIQDTVTGATTTIGTIHLLNSGGGQGYGNLTKGASTFTEYFGGVESCEGQPYARIRWRGPYANAAQIPPSGATVSWYGYPCPAQNDQSSPAIPQVVVETGGSDLPITHPNGTQLWPACSYQISPSDDQIRVASAACFDPSLKPLASTSADVANYGAWTYPDGSPVGGTVTAVVNGTDSWAVFYKQTNFGGDSFCLGPHRYAELHAYSGWNDVVASHRVLRSSDPCTPPPGCTNQLPLQRCGDGVVQSSCGEQCDVGPTSGSGCCDTSCQLRPAGASCNDGDQCTHVDTCDGSGSCAGASGCGDGTVDAQCEQCDPASGQCCSAMCRFSSAGTACNDSDTCTSSDACDGGGLCNGTVTPSDSCGTGLTGEYFDGPEFSGAKLVRDDPRINFDWRDGAPDATMGTDQFSVRWSGSLLPKFTEQYSFHASTDDGVRLWVNDQLIVNHWQDQPPTERTGTIALQAGKKVPIRMEYFENLGVASAKLAWSSLHQAKQIVPQSALFSSCGDAILEEDEECDDGNLTPGDGCEPDCHLSAVCAGGKAISSARLTMSRLGGALGDESLTFTGRMAFNPGQPAGFSPLDTLTRGAQVLIEDLGDPDTPVLELSHRTHPVPPGPKAGVCFAQKKDGWTANAASTTYSYTNVSNALPAASCSARSAEGLKSLVFTDKRQSAHKIDVKLSAAKARIAKPIGPLRVTIVLSANPADGVAGACGQVTFANCAFTTGGTSLLCR